MKNTLASSPPRAPQLPRFSPPPPPPALPPLGPLQDGNWSDVSGENFLRTLLTKPVEEIRWAGCLALYAFFQAVLQPQ